MSDFINEKEKLPLYLVTKFKLLDILEQMPRLSPVPSERDLCNTLRVSRPTIRKALKILEDEEEIFRIPGKGAFTSDKHKKLVDSEMDSFIGFYENVEMQRRKSKTKVLQQSVVGATKSIAEKLNIKEEDKIFVLERLRFIEEEPICIVSSYLPLNICPELTAYDFTDASLYKILKANGLTMKKAIRSIEAKQANVNEATLLNIDSKGPILLFKSVGFQKNEVPFEYVISRYVGTNVKFTTEVYK